MLNFMKLCCDNILYGAKWRAVRKALVLDKVDTENKNVEMDMLCVASISDRMKEKN